MKTIGYNGVHNIFRHTHRYIFEKESQMLHGAGIFTYIYPKNGPNVGKYSIRRAYGNDTLVGGFNHFFIFHHVWVVILPIEFHIFQRGRLNYQPVQMDPSI